VHILIVTNHFWPENFRINDLALGLRERGHDITVFTGVPDYPDGKFYQGYGVFRRRREEWQGVSVIRFPLIPRGKGRSFELVFNYLSSAFFSCLLAPLWCRDRYDVIFVFETSPVTIGLCAILLKKLKGIPVFFWILDLWPESLSATGAVRAPLLLKQVRSVVRLIYGNCDRLLTSSRRFSESIEETGGYSGVIKYFPNWVEPEYFSAVETVSTCQLPVLPEGFLVMFAGNIGAAQDFESILSAAEILKNSQYIHWIVLGDGRKANWVREQVKTRGLERSFHLLGKFPASTMPAFFRQADVLLATLKKDPIFALTVPGKVQSYMACGKPVLAAMDGEGARIIEEAGAGLSCPAESPVLLAEKIQALYTMAEKDRQQMAERGKKYCFAHFNRENLFAWLEAEMKEAVAGEAKD
jgi:colanic acid biosynthesis glycosyl transferase WcaI